MHTIPEKHRMVVIESWGCTHQGNIREENQDCFLNWPERRVWAVADGVGGTDFGAQASKAVIRALLQLRPPSSLQETVAETGARLKEVNDALRRQEAAAGSAASTVVALLIHEGEAACVWAGDSRCYLLRDEVLYQCTKDHTLRQQKIDTGDLTAPEAHRMIRGNIITRAIGVRDEPMLEEVRFSLRKNDRFLLCSDGLTNILEAQNLSWHLGKPSARECCDSLQDALSGMPQPDNITYVAVYLSAVA